MKKIKGSFKWKLVLLYALLYVIVIGIMGFFILNNIQNTLYDARYKELKYSAGRISDTMSLMYDASSDNLKTVFSQTSAAILTEGGTEDLFYICLLDPSGALLSSGSYEMKEADLASRTILQAAAGAETESLYVHRIQTENESIMAGDYAVPVYRGKDIWYILFLRKSVADIAVTMQNNSRTILMASALAVGLCALMSYLLSSGITRPIRKLTSKTKDLASGNLDETKELSVNQDASDEIEELESNFNQMARELSRTLSESNSERNKLSTIFQHLADGLIVYDINGNVLQSNIAATELLGSGAGENNFKSMFPKENMLKLLYLPPNKVEQRMQKLDDRFVHLVFAPYQNDEMIPEGLIVVLQDVTEQFRAQEMQREFVANVSHELRTPITTVKSYVETLLDGGVDDPDTSQMFLQIINQESDRMNTLISELLDLSRIDNRQVSLHMLEIDAAYLLEECIERYRILAERKHQTMTMLPSPHCRIRCDRARMEQVIRNLLTNAVNYSPENADIAGSVTYDEAAKQVVMHIRDNGMGIPFKEQKRIFERFYRIDKARSRSSGGTGLGLAIVKEIMEMHHGRVEVDSLPGKGSTFHLIFPEVDDE